MRSKSSKNTRLSARNRKVASSRPSDHIQPTPPSPSSRATENPKENLFNNSQQPLLYTGPLSRNGPMVELEARRIAPFFRPPYHGNPELRSNPEFVEGSSRCFTPPLPVDVPSRLRIDTILQQAPFYILPESARAPPLSPDGTAIPWPPLSEFRRRTGTRNLLRVVRLHRSMLDTATMNFNSDKITIPNLTLSDKHILPPLMLAPLAGGADLTHFRILDEIDDCKDLRKLICRLILPFITQILCIIFDASYQANPVLSPMLDFVLCATPQAPWDIIGFRNSPSQEDYKPERSLLIFVLHPSTFGPADAEIFADNHRFFPGMLDMLDGAHTMPRSSVILWAALYDACTKAKCHHWIVTTYNDWIFGNFSRNHRCAAVSPVLTPPLYAYNGEPIPGMPEWESRSTLLEMLTYWFSAAFRVYESINLPQEVALVDGTEPS